MRIENLETLYIEQLKDLHDAEKQFSNDLPRLAERASAEHLRTYLQSEVDATGRQLDRLDGLCEDANASPAGERCDGMAGLLKEVERLTASCETPEARDAALIAGLQRVKHYEIAGYGCARTFAERLGESEAAHRLQETLEEESRGDRALSRLATESINELALDAVA